MAKSTITSITTTQTFQNWFDKTNELVALFRDETLTASVGGDITTGNAILNGNFTATNITANTSVFTDSLASQTGGATIAITSPISIDSSQQTVAVFKYGADGGQTQYTDGTVSWDVGIEDSANHNFIIDTGVGVNKFQLTPAGTLTAPNIVTGEDMLVGQDLTVTGNTNILGTLTVSNGIGGGGGGGLTVDDIYCSNIFATGDVTTKYSASDINLKENIKVIENPIEKINALSGYTFNYKGQEELVTGVIAQEVEQVLPGVVYTGPEGFKAVRYGNMVGLLIEAVKELSAEVERLKNGSSD